MNLLTIINLKIMTKLEIENIKLECLFEQRALQLKVIEKEKINLNVIDNMIRQLQIIIHKLI